MKTKSLFLLLFMLSITGFVRSQETYKTLNGDLAITISYGDTMILMVSNKLLATVDYETSKVTFRASYETFSTGIDSFDRRIKALRDSSLEFVGKMGIRVDPKKYDPQKYNMEGTLLSANPPLDVRGNGTMTCMAAANSLTPACTLLLSIETTLSALNLTQVFRTAKSNARIDLRQSVLEKVRN